MHPRLRIASSLALLVAAPHGGFKLCDNVAPQRLLLDQNDFGGLPTATTQPSWDSDVFGVAGSFTFLYLSLGTTAAGSAAASVPAGLVPLPWTGTSWNDVFLLNGGPISLVQTSLSPFGYGTISLPNPNPGGYAGFTFRVQGFALQPTGFELSSPLLVQLQ